MRGIADGALKGYSSTFSVDKDKIDPFKIPAPEDVLKRAKNTDFGVRSN